MTAADRLLFNVQADPSVSYVALFGRYESGALTLYYRKKNAKREEQVTEQSVPEEELDDGTDSAEQFSKTVRKSLQATDRDGEILIACAWTDDESRRKFEMLGALRIDNRVIHAVINQGSIRGDPERRPDQIGRIT